MKKPNPARQYLRTAALMAGLLLPTLTLVPLGSLWLWQNGYLLHWAGATAALVLVAYLLQRRLLAAIPPAEAARAALPADEAGDPTWTPAEQQAWAAVVEHAHRVDPTQLVSSEQIYALGADTVRVVARRLHPEATDPMLQFTMPEAFAIAERVSRRLGRFAVDNIPLSDRLTVAQVMALYRWRGAVEVAEKAYDIWRLARMFNPVTAATSELRERLSRQMLQWGREHVTRRLAHAFVTEVGRAAIDLYGGRLRVSAQQLETEQTAAARGDAKEIASRDVEPLRILLAGQVGAGKSSLLNALAGEVHAAIDALPTTTAFTAYRLERSGFPLAHFIDSQGLGASADEHKAMVEQAIDADLVLWIIPAHRADREIDRRAINGFRQAYEKQPNRRTPPILLVLSHIDRLRPFDVWAPPYDLNAASEPKAKSIVAAIDAAAGDLGFERSGVVPVSLLAGAQYNVETLWARILMVLPDAQQAQLVRRLHDARSNWNWRRVWSQAVGVGRILKGTLVR